MGVGADLCMYDVVVKKFTFAISSPDEFLLTTSVHTTRVHGPLNGGSKMTPVSTAREHGSVYQALV